MIDNEGGSNVISFAEAGKRIKEKKRRKQIEEILQEELPASEDYNDFGIAGDRKEIIDRLTKIFADPNALGTRYLNSMRAQLSIDTSLDSQVRKKMIKGLANVINKCRREFTNYRYPDDSDIDTGI